MSKNLEPIPAAFFAAVLMQQDVLSFDGESVCKADCEVAQYTDTIIMPEEAEQRGINLQNIWDTGVSFPVTLEKELCDWRLFCESKPEEMLILGNHIWINSCQKMIWINPRICKAIQHYSNNGFIIPRGFQKETQQEGICIENHTNRDEIFGQPMLNYQPRLPVSPFISSVGVFADWTICTLYLNAKKTPIMLANFIPVPDHREYRFDSAGARSMNYDLIIYFWQYSVHLIVGEKELSNLYPVIRNSVDAAVVYGHKANSYLEQFVRSQLPMMNKPDKTVFVDAGWQHIGGETLYGCDNRMETKGYSFACGRRLEVKEMTIEQSWGAFCEMLNVSQDIRISATAMLYCFLGISYTLFQEGGFPLNFLLFLVGTTGSLKTAFSKVIFDIFNLGDTGCKRSHTFSDTITATEQYVGHLKDEVGVIDDLELGDSDVEARRQQEVFNLIVRMVGDAKGKNRSNSALRDVKANVARGLVALTGEQSMGKQSTRLRIVELEVRKGAILGERLAAFQDDPYRWPAVCAQFIAFLERNIQATMNYISSKSRELRREYQQKFRHLRTVDQLIAFAIVNGLLKQFWCKNLENDETVTTVLDKMLSAVEEVLVCSSIEEEEANPGIRFLQDLDAMVGSGDIKIANDLETFMNTTMHIGFRDEWGDIFLIRDQAYQSVVNYEARMKRRFAFDIPKILKSLDEIGAIYKFKNGKTSTFSVRKNGQIFIKINGNLFRKVVEAN